MTTTPAISSNRFMRRALLVAFGVCLSGIAVLASERLILRAQIVAAADHLNEVTKLTGEALLEDEKATHAIRLAVTTRDPSYLSQYREALDAIELSLSKVAALGPPEADVYAGAAGAANTQLVDIERRAIELLKAGYSLEARSMLESDGYLAEKEKLRRQHELLAVAACRRGGAALGRIKASLSAACDSRCDARNSHSFGCVVAPTRGTQGIRRHLSGSGGGASPHGNARRADGGRQPMAFHGAEA